MQAQGPEQAHARRLLAIQTLAGFSQWIDVFLIFSVPAFLWQSTPGQIAFMASCFGLPGLFLGPMIGALLDQLDARRAACCAAVARTALTGFIAFAPGFEFFAVLVLLKGVANVFYWPATAILTQQLVAPAARVQYFSSLSALDQVTKIITPLIAGAATWVMDAQLIFLLSCALTLVCALWLFFLPRSTTTPHERGKHLLIDAWRGLSYGWKSMRTLPSGLVVSIGLGIGVSLALAIYDPHLAAFLNSIQLDATAFALLISSTGFGAVCGALLVRFLGKSAHPSQLMRTGLALFFTATAGAAILSGFHAQAIGIVPLMFLWFINGLGYEIFIIGCNVNMQNLCPPHLLGRVSTSARSLQMSAVVAGPLIGAWLISVQSRATPFGVSAVIALALFWTAMVAPPEHGRPRD